MRHEPRVRIKSLKSDILYQGLVILLKFGVFKNLPPYGLGSRRNGIPAGDFQNIRRMVRNPFEVQFARVFKDGCFPLRKRVNTRSYRSETSVKDSTTVIGRPVVGGMILDPRS